MGQAFRAQFAAKFKGLLLTLVKVILQKGKHCSFRALD